MAETNLRPFPRADRRRAGAPYEHEHPRLAAIRHLREAIAAGRAGLDPYDQTIFVVDAREHERVWTNRCLELCGLRVGSTLNWNGTGLVRYRGVLEADVRQELGLDEPHPPVLDDEPLASRRNTLAEEAVVRAGEALLANPKTPVLRPIADAQRERQVH